MTTAQNAMYWAEWARARDVLRSRGLTVAQAEARRHELHRQALGRDKSSKEFTNADLDAVLAAIKGVYDGGNLGAQLAQLEMPERRAAMAVRRIESLKHALGLAPGRESGYVAGMARNLFGAEAGEAGQWHTLDAGRLARLEGVIVRRLRQLHDGAAVARLRAAAQAEAERTERIVQAAAARAGELVEEPF